MHQRHRDVPRLVCLRGALPCPPTDRPRERYDAPDCRLDRPTAPRGLALGHGATFSPPRSRLDLRVRPAADRTGDRHRGGADSAARALAESVCRAPDWLPAARVSRPRHRVKRALVAPPPPAIPRLLSRVANAPLAGQGCARPASATIVDRRYNRPSPASRRFASSLRTARGLTVALRATDNMPPLGSSAVVGPHRTAVVPELAIPARSGFWEPRVGDAPRTNRTSFLCRWSFWEGQWVRLGHRLILDCQVHHAWRHHLFRVGRHLLRAAHHRLLRARSFGLWDKVTCAC